MNSRVYTIAGAKGGVGKTTSSINIGASLAGEGYSTVVVELDLAMANLVDFLDIDIDVTEDTTLHDVLAGSASVEAATYRTESGLWVIPSGTNLRGYADTDLKRLPKVVETLRGEFDVVLLDTPAGLSEETVRPMQLSDEVLLISTPRVASVRNARNTQDLAERVGVDVRGLVLTKSGTGASPGAERIASFLETELLGHVPEDEAVPHSQDSGYPVVTNAPKSGAAIAYRRITEKLAESIGERTGERETSVPDRSSDSDGSTDDERLAEKIAAVSDSQATPPSEVESGSAPDEVHLADPVTDESEDTEPQSDESLTDEEEDAQSQSEESLTDEEEDAQSQSDDESAERPTVPNIDPALAAKSPPGDAESMTDTQQGNEDQDEPESESTEEEATHSEDQPNTTSEADAAAADSKETERSPQTDDDSSEGAAESEPAADGGPAASGASTTEAAESRETTEAGDESDTEPPSPSTETEDNQSDETPSTETEESQFDETPSTETEESQSDDASAESSESSRSFLGRVLSLFF